MRVYFALFSVAIMLMFLSKIEEVDNGCHHDDKQSDQQKYGKIIEIARFLQANNLDIDLTLLILLFFINTVKWLPAVGSVATLH